MKLNELMQNNGARTERRRVGRGPGSGLGKTSGKGEKVKKLVVVYLFQLLLKVDNYHYIEDFLKEDSLMPNLKSNMQSSMYLI